MTRPRKFSPSPAFRPTLCLTTRPACEKQEVLMRCLRLLVSFLLISTPLALAQRDSHPSSAPSGSSAPASSPAPAASAPSSPNSGGGGGGSSHSNSAPSSSNPGSNPGSSAGRSSGGGSGGGNSNGGHPNMGGGNNRSDHGNSNNTNSPRSDRSNSGNNGRGDRGNNGLDRRVQPDNTNTARPDATRNGGADSRSGKQRHENSLTPNTNRDNRGDVSGHSKPGPTVNPKNDSEKANKSHFHWFWKRSPKNPEETATAKGLRPDLKRPTPCKGVNCRPTPACPTGQTAGEAGGCVPSVPNHGNCDGTVDAHGNCIPNDACTNGNAMPGTNCPQNAAQYQNRTDCSAVSAEVGGLKNQIEILLREEQLACGQVPNAPNCVRIRDELLRLQERLRQAQRRYASCLSRP
jgi:hypothetical protein